MLDGQEQWRLAIKVPQVKEASDKVLSLDHFFKDWSFITNNSKVELIVSFVIFKRRIVLKNRLKVIL